MSTVKSTILRTDPLFDVTDAPLGEVAGTGETVGQVMTGGVQGTTMPLCVPVMLEFDSSVAVRL